MNQLGIHSGQPSEALSTPLKTANFTKLIMKKVTAISQRHNIAQNHSEQTTGYRFSERTL